MSKKSLGYVEMEWVCPNCQGRNPGSVRVCAACGSPQPENVQFQQKEGADLVQDAEKIEQAAKTPDIHCPYCATRNPADAKVCSQCGGDLVEGKKRVAGQVVGAASISSAPILPVVCPNCGTSNPGQSTACSACGALLHKPAATTSQQKPAAQKPANAGVSLLVAIPLGVCLLLCCIVAAFFFFRTESTTGRVQSVAWQCEVQVEALRDTTREDWQDEVPADGRVLSCSQKVRDTVDHEVPNSREVCGTPYEVDKGNGYSERVQDCVYEVYDDYCKYEIKEWQVVDKLETRGDDYQPYCDDVNASADQRQGDTSLDFVAYFQTESGVLEYHTSDQGLFEQLQPGTQWNLKVNSFGQVVDVER